MATRVVVLGAGFGGLELTTMLSEAFGDALEIVLIDKADSFVFGFSKLDVMFGRQQPAAVRHAYRDFVKPGVRFVHAVIESIDPAARRVATSAGAFEADILVVALGAEMDLSATPGLAEGGNEFYSVPGAEALREILPAFERGRAIIGITAPPFKCPPAPSETALLLHDYLVERGRRAETEIALIMPFPVPVPSSVDASRSLLAAFEARGIRYVGDSRVTALDPARKVALLHDGREEPYDLYLGVPVHRPPRVVLESGLAENGWIPVDKGTLQTRFPGVYAVGDVTSVGTPKAGVFAESAAQTAAAGIIAHLRGEPAPPPYEGIGYCYLEFGHDQVGRINANVFGGPAPVGEFVRQSDVLAAEKLRFGSERVQRWFGRDWRYR